jgi:hypothetical protein
MVEFKLYLKGRDASSGLVSNFDITQTDGSGIIIKNILSRQQSINRQGVNIFYLSDSRDYAPRSLGDRDNPKSTDCVWANRNGEPMMISSCYSWQQGNGNIESGELYPSVSINIKTSGKVARLIFYFNSAAGVYPTKINFVGRNQDYDNDSTIWVFDNPFVDWENPPNEYIFDFGATNKPYQPLEIATILPDNDTIILSKGQILDFGIVKQSAALDNTPSYGVASIQGYVSVISREFGNRYKQGRLPSIITADMTKTITGHNIMSWFDLVQPQQNWGSDKISFGYKHAIEKLADLQYHNESFDLRNFRLEQFFESLRSYVVDHIGLAILSPQGDSLVDVGVSDRMNNIILDHGRIDIKKEYSVLDVINFVCQVGMLNLYAEKVTSSSQKSTQANIVVGEPNIEPTATVIEENNCYNIEYGYYQSQPITCVNIEVFGTDISKSTQSYRLESYFGVSVVGDRLIRYAVEEGIQRGSAIVAGVSLQTATRWAKLYYYKIRDYKLTTTFDFGQEYISQSNLDCKMQTTVRGRNIPANQMSGVPTNFNNTDNPETLLGVANFVIVNKTNFAATVDIWIIGSVLSAQNPFEIRGETVYGAMGSNPTPPPLDIYDAPSDWGVWLNNPGEAGVTDFVFESISYQEVANKVSFGDTSGLTYDLFGNPLVQENAKYKDSITGVETDLHVWIKDQILLHYAQGKSIVSFSHLSTWYDFELNQQITLVDKWGNPMFDGKTFLIIQLEFNGKWKITAKEL